MKKKDLFEDDGTDEILYDDSRRKKSRPSDIAVRTGILLLLPYVLWLSRYNDDYVASIHGKIVHLDFDGVMQSLHNLLNSANMIVHEAGHGVCYLFACPQFITALNGTLFQLLLPVIFIHYYYRRENPLLVGMGGIWLAQNLVYVAWYMSTSHTPNRYPMFLPGGGTHDFWFLFRELGVYEYDWLISGAVRFVAVILLVLSYFYLLYLSFLKNEKGSRRGKRFTEVHHE